MSGLHLLQEPCTWFASGCYRLPVGSCGQEALAVSVIRIGSLFFISCCCWTLPLFPCFCIFLCQRRTRTSSTGRTCLLLLVFLVSPPNHHPHEPHLLFAPLGRPGSATHSALKAAASVVYQHSPSPATGRSASRVDIRVSHFSATLLLPHRRLLALCFCAILLVALVSAKPFPCCEKSPFENPVVILISPTTAQGNLQRERVPVTAHLLDISRHRFYRVRLPFASGRAALPSEVRGARILPPVFAPRPQSCAASHCLGRPGSGYLRPPELEPPSVQ